MISTASDDVNGSDKQMVLYAQWEDLPRVTVSLDANGGAVEPNDKTVNYRFRHGKAMISKVGLHRKRMAKKSKIQP